MRVILSAAGRAALREFAIAFFPLAGGVWVAPNLDAAGATVAAASIAGVIAAARGLRVFVPQLSSGIAKALKVPLAYAEVVITAGTTLGLGFLVLVEGVAGAPNLTAAKAAGLAGLLAIGTGLYRVVQAWLTPGEPGGGGISTPPQPVPSEALPEPMPATPTPEP